MTIIKDIDTLTPFYRLKVDGKSIPESVMDRIQTLTYEENDLGADTLQLEVEDSIYYFLDNPQLFEDLPIEAELGYESLPAYTFKGYIIIVQPSFTAGGQVTASITCMDESHLLNKKKKIRTWNNMKISDILTKIAKEYKLKADIQATSTVYEKLTQSNETDIQFICKLVNGLNNDSLGSGIGQKQPVFSTRQYMVKIKNQTMTFKERVLSTNDSRRDLWYNSGEANIISFSPTYIRDLQVKELNASEGNSNKKSSSGGAGVDTATGKSKGTSEDRYFKFEKGGKFVQVLPSPDLIGSSDFFRSQR